MTIRMGLLSLLAGALVLAPSFARATAPGSNGKIVFTRYRLQDNPLWSEIYVANQDGSGEHRVSHSASARLDNQPHWSPDGKLIVFTRCGKFVCSIWLVRPDGSEQRPLTHVCWARPPACPDNSRPAFAPDGRHVVFVHEGGRIRHRPTGDEIANSEIVMTDLEGRHMKVLRRSTGFRVGFGQPELSPDGTKLVYRRYNSSRTPPVWRRALFVVNVNGGKPRRITPWSLRATSGDWAPDGSRILFASNAINDNNLAPGTNLYSIRPDGTGLRRLTNVGGNHYVLNGSYSPDGKAIVYATDLDATPKPLGGNTFPDIVTQPLGGGPVTRITHSANLDGWPAWGSDAQSTTTTEKSGPELAHELVLAHAGMPSYFDRIPWRLRGRWGLGRFSTRCALEKLPAFRLVGRARAAFGSRISNLWSVAFVTTGASKAHRLYVHEAKLVPPCALRWIRQRPDTTGVARTHASSYGRLADEIVVHRVVYKTTYKGKPTQGSRGFDVVVLRVDRAVAYYVLDAVGTAAEQRNLHVDLVKRAVERARS